MTVKAIRNIAAPNYPIAPEQYSRQFQDQYTNVTRLFSNTIANAVNAPKVHGSFYDTTTQTNPVASAVNLMTLNNTTSAYSVRVGQPTSRVYVGETGVYNIQFSAQLDKTSGASAQSVYIWLRVNGTNVANSASQVTLKDTTAELVAAWNFIVTLETEDYFELAWASPDVDMQLKAVSSDAGPPVIPTTVPAIPSVILTVSWVSNIPS
jgi:hypothetical protein